MSYSKEKELAISAVRRACGLTSSVFNRLVQNEKLVKGDKSPVTVGDFSAQALISAMIHHAFPSDVIVGEEDAADLRLDTSESTSLRERIVALANEALTQPLVDGETAEWEIGPGKEQTSAELLDAIDRGNYEGGRTGRMWCIDPIDGTKGFLRADQYAVCLALIVDSIVQVGVIGCPNLPLDLSNPSGERGCIFFAVRGEGAFQIPITSSPSISPPTKIQIPLTSDTSKLTFLESFESAHASHSTASAIASLLGVTNPPIRMDSQAKYGCLARGDGNGGGGVYMRLPVSGLGPTASYIEKIWDHAPGSLLVEEAGGIISDARGHPLDFGLGRTLGKGENWGVIATGKDVHAKVLEAVKKAFESEGKTLAKA
ncbi:3(2),5-bisphosphate nucleotidase HAL2 [Dendrothele bispora CBS 962.96]|uniref:3'(2'),5'-bisphosphate nucleotidase n=1 Tax=Dendrothele bispora (strain CBS 962.96) TaxID=1314807 RepID=A0A4S8MHP9_DENBC|nr:3(2),5-bisphosphate nucleotidase HAL2 [Dendrothele bispora CBS 962.96]